MSPYSITNHCTTLGVQYLGDKAASNYLVMLAFIIHLSKLFPFIPFFSISLYAFPETGVCAAGGWGLQHLLQPLRILQMQYLCQS